MMKLTNCKTKDLPIPFKGYTFRKTFKNYPCITACNSKFKGGKIIHLIGVHKKALKQSGD